MQCPRCKFENMPGLKTCFHCGSVLDGSSGGVDIIPPRAPAWKKPFRRVLYWLRRRTILGRIEKSVEETRLEAEMSTGDFSPPPKGMRSKELAEAKRIVWGAIPWVLISTIPGLAHLIQWRFRRVWSWWASWLSTLFYALFFFCPRTLPVVMLAIAIILHAWIAGDAGLVWTRVRSFSSRLLALVPIALWIFVLYFGVRVTVLRSFDIGESIVTIPSLQVERGDYLLCRRITDLDSVKNGDLILVEYQGGNIVTQVIGIPKDRVSIAGGGFVVNGETLDADLFPRGDWSMRDAHLLPGGGEWMRRPLHSGEFLVRMMYSRHMRGYAELLDGGRRDTFFEGPLTVYEGEIRSRAFMRWIPIGRRGFLHNAEEPE